MLEELRRLQMEEVQRKITEARRRRRKRLFILFPLVLLVITGVFLALQVEANRHFEVTRYCLESGKVKTPIKLVVLSDLHSMEYGEENRELIEAIQREQPDLIAMVGDMVNKDDEDFTGVRYLCRRLKEIAPVYYTLGNHEGTLMYGRLDSVPLDELLTEEGARVLINETAEFQKGETLVRLAGISNEAAGYDRWAKDKLADFWESEGYKIVLSHFPDLYYEKLKDARFDLALAGHYHGGLIRVTGIGGLYHPEDGLFPKYSGGEYPLTNGTLIVSRGIGGHGLIPRIHNRPELVIVEIAGSADSGTD